MLVSPVFMCVCVCVSLVQGKSRDEGNKRGDAKQPEEETRHHKSEGGCSLYLCSAPVQDRNEERRPVITQELGSRNLQLDKIQKHAHHFYRVVVSVWTRKRGCMVSGFTQGKSGGVGL